MHTRIGLDSTYAMVGFNQGFHYALQIRRGTPVAFRRRCVEHLVFDSMYASGLHGIQSMVSLRSPKWRGTRWVVLKADQG
jgi:hypothetical protein